MGQPAARARTLLFETGALAPSPVHFGTTALVANWRLLHWRFIMLRWALGLLVAALVTGFFAFLGLPAPVEWAARVLFVTFLAGFLVTLFMGLIGGRKTGT